MTTIPAPLPSPSSPDETAVVSETGTGRPLTQFREGQRGRLAPSDLDPGDRALLDALGLAERCRFRISKAGDPWILQVRGTRIGLATAVARRLRVLPDEAS